MEDWIGIALFLFFFLILPLLQGIAQRRKGQQEQPDEEWEAAADEEPGRRRRIEPAHWEEEWAETAPRGEPARERSAWEDLNLDDLFREPRPEPRPEPQRAPRAEPRPEPRPVPTPTQAEPSWEPFPTPAPVPVPKPRQEPARRPPVVVSRTPPPVPVPQVRSLEALEVDWSAERERFRSRYLVAAPAPKRAETPRLLPDLRDPAEIRRALVMAEVFGPPRSLREHEVRQ
jgi:hypothetical protein